MSKNAGRQWADEDDDDEVCIPRPFPFHHNTD